MEDEEKAKIVDTLGTLVYKLRCDLAEIRDYYDNKIVDDKELVETFNDEYPFEIDMNELYLRVLDWDESTGKAHRKIINRLKEEGNEDG